MKRKFHILFLVMAVAAMGMTSCGKEDAPVFEFTDPTEGFIPADSAMDELSVLRRQFYAENGSYLLFNDTLQHKYLGKDLNGDDKYFTELLDIQYEVGQTNTATTKVSYTNLGSVEKCVEAVDYLKRFILPHLSTKLRPFSWYIASTITYKDDQNTTTRPYAISGQRAIALACNLLNSLKTDAQKEQLATRHMLVIAANVANNNSTAFSDFLAVSSSYYSTDLPAHEGKTTTEVVREKGFLSSISISSYPTTAQDISAFCSLVLNYTDAQIEKAYAKYPLIVSKAKMFRADLESLGYIY